MPPDAPDIEVIFLTKRPEHPPITGLLFEVTLRNHFDGPRWFMLPSKFSSASEQMGGNGVSAVQVFALGGQGRVIVGRFLGAPGFQALLLPAGAELKLRRFPIQFFGKLPEDSLSMEVVIASQLTIGGEPAEAWFGMDPTCDLQADVTEDQRQRLGSRHAPDLKAVPVSIGAERRVTLQVNLSETVDCE